MKVKKALFICQITDTALKVIKYGPEKGERKELLGLESEDIPYDINSKELGVRVNGIFAKLEYNSNPIIVSLPRSKATCRYLKIPSQSAQEIENIVSLQISSYLPYPAAELISGYQVVQTDKQGYSHINLVIVHKSVIEKYLAVFSSLKCPNFTIALSSYAIVNLYNYIQPRDKDAAMLVDIDGREAEIAIVSQGKLIFSRYFKFPGFNQPDWSGLFLNEINKTQDAYVKEVGQEPLNRIVLLDSRATPSGVAGELKKHTSHSVELFSYADKMSLPADMLKTIIGSQNSFATLVGMGFEDISESLNLLPQELKKKAKDVNAYKERVRVISAVCAIVLMLGLATAKSINNKAQYLKALKTELSKIENDAKALAEIEKRFELLQSRSQKKPSSLDVLYELHKILPAQVSLVNFNYEEDNQVTLHGQTPELSTVFSLVSELEKSPVFNNYNPKVRYATKKITSAGETIDFEILISARGR